MVHPVARGFPWQRLAHRPSLPITRAHDLLVRTIHRIEDWGIVIPAGSRLLQAQIALRTCAERSAVPEDARERECFAEGMRTAVEWYLATHGYEGEPTPAMREKLAQALGGAELSTEESQHFARDIQFELYVHGTLSAGGLGPWFDERPDLRIKYGADPVGVAVKRIWSLDQAHKQLSRAATQIEESGLRGIIATNAQEYLDILPATTNIEVRGTAFSEQVARLHGQFPYLAGKPHVLGLLICGTVAEWAADGEDGPVLRMATYNQLFVLEEQSAEARGQAFGAQLGDNLRTWLSNIL